MLDLDDAIFQAQCQIDNLRYFFEDGGRIRHVRDDQVTLDLADDSETEVNLQPIQRLLNALREMKD